MQQPKELSLKERIIEKTVLVLNKLKLPLIIFMAALAVFIVVYLIVGEVRTKKTETSTILVERIEDDFASWLGLEEAEERETIGLDILERLESVISDYPRFYAAQRALYIQGSIFFQTNAWDAAKTSFSEIANRFPKSYLAPIALVNAATAMEEADEIDEAITLLERVREDFSTPEMPTVIFSLGRLHEAKEDLAGALTYYELLLDGYPSSGWTNIAQTRIIVINIDRS